VDCMKNPISEGRKMSHYIGTALMVVGGVSFLSIFLTAALQFGGFSHFHENAKSRVLRVLLGMVLLMIGGLVRSLAATGLAGSGVTLEREKAREDPPYSPHTTRVRPGSSEFKWQ